jgi:hypothetical protein
MLVSRKIIIGVILVAVLASFAFTWYQFPTPVGATRYGEYMSLGVSVDPSGSAFKLGVNESKTFSAVALNGSAPFAYVWSLAPSGNFTLSVNGVAREVVNGSSLSVAGKDLSLCFPVATLEFVSVNVVVTDVNGVSGDLDLPFVVADPYTSPGYKFDASTASFSFKVEGDNLGWYRVINGSDGSVVTSWTSTNVATLFTSVFAVNPPSVYVKSGSYSASLAIPAGCDFYAENTTTGISYTSIGNGAKINEPTFNSQFGGYESGTYSISTNGTLNLAFKSDDSIWYASNSFSTMMNNVLSGTGRISSFIRAGQYEVDLQIASTAQEVELYGAGQAGTILRLASGVTLPTMFNIGSGQLRLGWTIRDLTLDGYSSSGARVTTALVVFYGYDSLIENVKIQSVNGSGLQLRGINSTNRVWNTLISHVTIADVNGTGFDVYQVNDSFISFLVTSNCGDTTQRKGVWLRDSSTIWFDNCYFDLPIGDGLYVQDTNYVHVSKSYFIGAQRTGMMVYNSGAGAINNINVENSWFYGNGRETDNTYNQLQFYAPTGTITESNVHDNHFYGEGHSKYAIYTSDSGKFLNNTLNNNFFGVHLTSASNPSYGMATGWKINDNIGLYSTTYSQFPIYGANLVDFGNSDGWANATYTNNGSPKNLYISGTIITLAVNGQTVYTGTGGLVHLDYGDTFTPTFTSMTVVCELGK